MKIEKFGFRFRADISFSRTAKVSGIDSDIQDDDSGRHILLWDFDDTALPLIINELTTLQNRWALPDIRIMQSSLNSYHALCFKALPYPLVLNILSSTKYLDLTYFKLGIVRGYFTLRYTSKDKKNKITLARVLKSDVSADNWAVPLLKISDYTTEVH